MGDSIVLQEIHFRAPEETGVGTSRKEIQKTYKNYLTLLFDYIILLLTAITDKKVTATG